MPTAKPRALYSALKNPSKRPSAKRNGLGVAVLTAGFALAAPPAQSEAQQAEESPNSLSRVVVTASRRPAPTTETAFSISTFGEADITSARAQELEDLAQLAAGFGVERRRSVFLRGVGGGGRNIGFGTRVGVYLDGVYVGQLPSMNLPLDDVARIEVLRGPQGNLFGKNTVAGAISIITTPPSATPSAQIMIGLGDYGGREAAASATGPMGSGVLGKLSLSHRRRDGWTLNRFDGGKLDSEERTGARGALRFEVSPGITLDLNADASAARLDEIIGEPITGTFGNVLAQPPTPREVNFNTRPFRDIDIGGASATAEVALSNEFLIRSISAVRYTRERRVNDIDYSALDVLKLRYEDEFLQYTEELQLLSPSDRPVRFVAGLYLLKEEADTARQVTAGANIRLLPAGMAPFAVVPSSGAIDAQSAAVFGTVELDLGSRLTAELGGRLTTEQSDTLYNLDGSQSGVFAIATLSNHEDERSETAFDPAVALRWRLTPDTNAYVRYAEGHKSGGLNLDFLTRAQVAADFSFDTERARTLEAGVKASGIGDLDIALTAFATEFSDFQVNRFLDIGGGARIIQLTNAARAESHGIEFSAGGPLTPRFDFGFEAAWLEANYADFPNGRGLGQPLDGAELPNAPNYTAAVHARYEIAAWTGGRLALSGDYSYRAGSYSDSFNDPVWERLDARNIVDLRLSLQDDDGRWEASVWGRNLFDEDYIAARARDFLGTQTIERGAPVTWGVELRAHL